MNDLEQEIELLKQKVKALETALQLFLVCAKPASEWLDKRLEEIEMRDKVARAKK